MFLADIVTARSVVVLAVNTMTSHNGIIVCRSWNLTRELLEGLALGLGDQKRGENTAQHEQREDLHNVVQPWAGSATSSTGLDAASTERTEHTLRNDGTDLAGGGGEAVGGGAVTGWEAFTGDDEGGGVGTEVEEELGEDVEGEESVAREVVVGESDDDEEYGEHGEAHELNGLAANGIDGCNGDPVTGDSTGENENEISNSVLAVDLVHVGSTSPSDGRENDGVVERETIVGDIKEEP